MSNLIIGIQRSTGQRLQKSRQIALFIIAERERVQVPFAVDVLATALVVEPDDVGERLRAAVVKVGRGQRDIAEAGRAIRPDVEDLIGDQNSSQLLSAFLFRQRVNHLPGFVGFDGRISLPGEFVEVGMDCGYAGVVIVEIGEERQSVIERVAARASGPAAKEREPASGGFADSGLIAGDEAVERRVA